jgi:hypothetical protein
MTWQGVWVGVALCFGLSCVACSSPCADVADQLRECCARGPSELRASCLEYAEQLEDDGNSEACESMNENELEQCGP